MKTNQQAFKEWSELASELRKRGKAIDDSKHDAAWKLAASVGIPRCGCSLHNASIDDDMAGWCKGNPERLKVAKQANHLLMNWDGSRTADKAIKAAWNRLLGPFGYAAY